MFSLRLAALSVFLPLASHALKVMTFNTWLSGREVTDGLEKIVHHIHLVNPDVVAFQEIQDIYVIPNITAMLGPDWSGVHHCNSTYPDTAIVTRHTIIPDSYAQVDWGMSVRLQIKQTMRQVVVWSLHLEYHSYGPYAAYNKLVTRAGQILAGEAPHGSVGRVQNIVELVSSEALARQIAKSNIVPIVIAGDFNAPSHLDWVEANKEAHGGWTFDWPATKILTDAASVIDAFRELHPDPIGDPGFTWSTVNKFNAEWDYTIPEPEDRIDFVFYRGPLKPKSSYVYCGNSTLTPIPKQWSNDWPSDHYAVITEFDDIPTSNELPPPLRPVPEAFTHTVEDELYRRHTPFCANNIFAADEPDDDHRA